MNTHTKKLFDRALDQAVPETWTTLSHEQMTRLSSVFAQLIVRECMRMCDCADVSYLEHGCDLEASGAAGAKQFIKEWFEVEE